MIGYVSFLTTRRSDSNSSYPTGGDYVDTWSTFFFSRFVTWDQPHCLFSGTTPLKKSRINSTEDKETHNLHDPCVEKDSTDETNRLFSRGSSSQGTPFRVAREFSSRLSSDCDETEVSSNQLKPVKSPSVLSNYSSAEDSYVGSTLSPTMPRSSPVMPIFRSNEPTKYSSYGQRVEGAIQVT